MITRHIFVSYAPRGEVGDTQLVSQDIHRASPALGAKDMSRCEVIMYCAMVDVLFDWAMWGLLNPMPYALWLIGCGVIVVGVGFVGTKYLEGRL